MTDQPNPPIQKGGNPSPFPPQPQPTPATPTEPVPAEEEPKKEGFLHRLEDAVGEALGEAFENR